MEIVVITCTSADACLVGEMSFSVDFPVITVNSDFAFSAGRFAVLNGSVFYRGVVLQMATAVL